MNNNKVQLVALYTLIRHECNRMRRIASQVFLPPVILTALYFLIFGTIIGKRVGSFDGINYIEFITPGLVMLSIITNAYGNVSSSLFSMRFQKSIEEILVSPLKPSFLLLGYILGGIIRGCLVAILVYLVAFIFIPISFFSLFLTFVVIVSSATLFSLAGFINGLIARNFDDVMIVPNFILMPLTYLGGIFYPLSLLPTFWGKVALLNPILYMVNALRYAMIGYEEVNILIALTIIFFIILLLFICNLILLKKGVGLRD